MLTNSRMRKLLEQHMSENKIITHDINLVSDPRTSKTKFVMEVGALPLDLPNNTHRLEMHGDWDAGAEISLYSRHGFILSCNIGFHTEQEVLACLRRLIKRA